MRKGPEISRRARGREDEGHDGGVRGKKARESKASREGASAHYKSFKMTSFVLRAEEVRRPLGGLLRAWLTHGGALMANFFVRLAESEAWGRGSL